MTTDLNLPYQSKGIEWLSKQRIALLADEMGLGKTYQVIKAVEKLGKDQSVLVVCPAIARLTWKKEFEKWYPSKLAIQILKKKTDKPNLAADVIICSFDYATINEDKKKLKITKTPTPAPNPDLVAWTAQCKPVMVIDESHFLKSLDARRTQAILGKAALVHFCSRTWFLTGTPMPNAPHELWPFLRIANATNLSYDAFIELFCKTYPFNGKAVVTGAKRENLPRLRALLAPVMLRRLKKDVMKDLPKVIEYPVFIEPDLKALPLINEEQKALLKVLSLTNPQEQIEALEVFASSIATLRRYCGLQKVFPVCELIKEELENNSYEKIVIFCIHKEIVALVSVALKNFGVVVVHGSVGADERQRGIEAFQKDGGARVFIGNIQAAGTNITLTKANQLVFIEEDYVPGNNAQAIARVDRIGQTSPVTVRRFKLESSIDDKINEILFRKSTDQRILFETV